MIKFSKKMVSLLVILLFIWISFAYTPTEKDTKIINTLDINFKAIYKKDPSQFEKIPGNIEKLKKYAKNDERLYYLLIEVEKIVNNLTANETTNSLYKLIEIIDWDTIKINYNWKNQNVRMIWVDAPEKNTSRFWYIECYWEESDNYLTELLWNVSEIKLEFDDTQWIEDQYGRLLWYVFVNWNNINETMIKKWYAWEYTYNKPYKYQQDFKNAELYAKNNKLWLWKTTACNWERKQFDETDQLLNNLIENTEENLNEISGNNQNNNTTENNNSYWWLCWWYVWYQWPKGWCYHWNWSKKVYWEHYCCK